MVSDERFEVVDAVVDEGHDAVLVPSAGTETTPSSGSMPSAKSAISFSISLLPSDEANGSAEWT